MRLLPLLQKPQGQIENMKKTPKFLFPWCLLQVKLKISTLNSSNFSLFSALHAGGWSTPRLDRLTSGKESRYSLYRKLGGPQGPSARVQKISPPVGFDPRAVHPVSSRYSDGAITAHTYFRQKNNHKLHVRLIYPLLLKYQ